MGTKLYVALIRLHLTYIVWYRDTHRRSFDIAPLLECCTVGRQLIIAPEVLYHSVVHAIWYHGITRDKVPQDSR
jgi:hypothetical protein